jgi:putative ABC transport system ATP-binding protein
MSERIVEVRDLAFGYSSGFQLSVDALNIERGGRVACIGPSGCGKSTLINLIAGVLEPIRGSVHIGGVCVSSLGPAARRAFRLRNIGMVFQEFELLDHLSALDNILLPYRLSSSQRITASERERARSLAATLGIGDLLRRSPKRMSQGERQRVSVCRALVTRPQLVIGDEPTGNLDPRHAAAVMDLLIAASSEIEAALLVVTHDHSMLPRFERVVDLGVSVGGAT